MESHLIEVITDGKYFILKNDLENEVIPQELLDKMLYWDDIIDNILMIELLLLHGANCNLTNATQPNTLLHIACRKGSMSLVKLLLKHGADINKLTHDSQLSPLAIACQEGNATCVKYLLENGADIDAGDIPPLQVYHNCHILNLLLDHGADVNRHFHDGSTALWETCKRGMTLCFEILLKNGADITAKININTTLGLPIFRKVFYCNVDCKLPLVKLLVEYGADIYETWYGGETPLSEASRQGLVSCVRYLLSTAEGNREKFKSTIDITYNGTANQAVCIATLISAGIKVTVRKKSDVSKLLPQLFIYCGEDSVEQFIQQLDDLTDISCTDVIRIGNYNWLEQILKLGVKPIHYNLLEPARKGDWKTIEILLRYGVDINIPDEDSALLSAIRCRYPDIISLLLSYGINHKMRFEACDWKYLYIRSRVYHGEEVTDWQADDNNDEVAEDGIYTLLSGACIQGDQRLVRLLLENKANPNIHIEHKSLLHALIEKRDYDCMKLLLQHGADVNIKSKRSGNTPLHEAVLYDDRDALQLLLEAGAGTSLMNHNDLAPLHVAAIHGLYRCMELLLDHGAEVDIEVVHPDDELVTAVTGYTPLRCAVENRHYNCVELLLARGADVNRKDNREDTLLHSVCRRCDGMQAVRLLVDYGTSLVAVDSDECTPLHTAILSNNDFHVIEYLVSHGADILAEDRNNRSSIAIAAQCNNIDCLQYLLDQVPPEDIDDITLPSGTLTATTNESVMSTLLRVKSDWGSLPIFQFGCVAHLIDVIPLLTDNIEEIVIRMCVAGCYHKYCEILFDCDDDDVRVTKEILSRGLMQACVYCHLPCADTLIHHGADVNATWSNSCSALYIACEETALFLLYNGADPNGGRMKTSSPTVTMDTVFYSPLHTACSPTNIRLANMLIAKGADVNMAVNGVTPLMAAIKDNKEEMVELLLKAGADVNLGCGEITPMFIAELLYGEEGAIEELLREYKGNKKRRIG